MDLPLTASSPIFIHISGLTSDCHLFKFSFLHLDLLSIASFFEFSSFHLDLLSIASRTHFHLFIWTYSLSPVNLIFIFSSGLTLYCQSNSFSSFHLDLLSIASQSHFHLFIWTYSLLPVKLILIFSSGLTLYCQSISFSSFHLDLLSIASLIVLSLHHLYLPDWTYTSDARLVGIRDSLKVLDFD